MAIKDCGLHDDHHKFLKTRLRRILCVLSVLFLIILIIVLVTFAILRPQKPKFVLQDATLYAFNVSSPNILTINLQATLSSRNPNDNIGVYYDRLDVYVTYGSQQITLRTRIPPTYQGHKEVDVWSPFVYGTNVPIAPYNGLTLKEDQMAGEVVLMIKIDGRVRWKVGTFISGSYHIYVECPAFITFGNRNNGVVLGVDAIKYQLVQKCSVST